MLVLIAAVVVLVLAWRAIRERSRRTTFGGPEDAPPFGHIRFTDGASLVTPSDDPNINHAGPFFDAPDSRHHHVDAAPAPTDTSGGRAHDG
jgi:hypothetical protein